MRIALAHPFVWPEVRRGGERYVEDLAVYLVGQGVEVDIVTGSPRSSSVQRRADGVTIRRRRYVLGHRLRRFGITEVETFGLSAVRALATGRYDVVHAMTPTAAIAARLARRPTVFTVIGHPTAEQLTHRRFDRPVFGAAFRGATVAAALSQASADQVEVLFHRKAEVLTPGVRSEQFVPDLAPRTGPPRILFSAAASDRRKGLDVALLAFARVLDSCPEARLQISGAGDVSWALASLSGDDRERVMASTDFLGTGSVGDVPARYRGASLTLLPSVDEAFGMALVESLATGTPVVCSPSGGMPEIVEGADVGAVAERTPEATAAAIIRVLALGRDEGTPRRCVEHAKKWDWAESVGPAHLDVYTRVARVGQREP
jgi:glycosyltransferase involved in cell wall biosynthesis